LFNPIQRRWAVAVAGYGLVYKSSIDLSPDLYAGRLIQLFPTAYGETTHLISSSRIDRC
jgi:hypothetical protein